MGAQASMTEEEKALLAVRETATSKSAASSALINFNDADDEESRAVAMEAWLREIGIKKRDSLMQVSE
jgi:hypothetical protein